MTKEQEKALMKKLEGLSKERLLKVLDKVNEELVLQVCKDDESEDYGDYRNIAYYEKSVIHLVSGEELTHWCSLIDPKRVYTLADMLENAAEQGRTCFSCSADSDKEWDGEETSFTIPISSIAYIETHSVLEDLTASQAQGKRVYLRQK